MKPPIRKMKKEEIVWLAEHRCRHGCSYLEHYNCYLREHPGGYANERIGFLDIETTGFYADYDYMLSWCILDDATGEILEDLIKPQEIRSLKFDKRIVKTLANAIRKFDRIVVFYGTDARFDIPFSRTRALKWGIDFPGYSEVFVEDAYTQVRNKLRLSKRRLGNVCDLLDIPAKTLPGKPNIWTKAAVGDAKALKYVLEHNREDVRSLQELYHRLRGFFAHTKRSI